MKKIFFIVLAVCSLSAYAQKRGNATMVPFMTNGIGISIQKFDNLNARVANLPQYKRLRDIAGTVQMGATKEYMGFVSAFTLTAGSSMSGDNHKRSSALNFLGIGIDLGYDFIPGNKLMLAPLIGVGAERYRAKFYTDNSLVPFDDVLTSPEVQNGIGHVSFVNSFITYRGGLAFSAKCGKENSSSIGLRVGYTGSFGDKAWRSNEGQSLLNSPEDNLSRFYGAIVLSHTMNYGRK